MSFEKKLIQLWFVVIAVNGKKSMCLYVMVALFKWQIYYYFSYDLKIQSTK